MRDKLLIILSLLAMYFIWGSTYLAIRFALDSLPPLLLTGTRLLLAGGILLAYLWSRGERLPPMPQMRNAALVGIMMLGGGVGSVTFAEQWVTSSIAAIVIATMPLWATLFASIGGKRPSGWEWAGLIAGLAGVLLLNIGGDLEANTLGLIILFFAPISWAAGSVLSRKLEMPVGSIAFAIEMLAGGIVLSFLGALRGESIPTSPTTTSLLAWLYLSIFGSLIAYSAYMYLLKKVSVPIATSYAYINPIVAVGLGIAFGGESISILGVGGMVVILGGVGLIAYSQIGVSKS